MSGLEQAIIAAQAQAQAQAQPQMVIASPLNDVQLIALVAAHGRGGFEAKEAVEWAIDVFVEAATQTNMGRNLAARIKAKMELCR